MPICSLAPAERAFRHQRQNGWFWRHRHRLWLSHESPASSRVYLHADMEIKERALARTTPPDTKPGRYTAPDSLLAFLDEL
jgi:hypothetical protein